MVIPGMENSKLAKENSKPAGTPPNRRGELTTGGKNSKFAKENSKLPGRTTKLPNATTNRLFRGYLDF